MIIDLLKISDHGLIIQGSYPNDILELEENEQAKADPLSPVHYDLSATCFDGELILTGEVSAGLLLVCARCMDEFRDVLNLTEYQVEIPIHGEVSVDLTNRIREDILLALPWYPHCAESTVEDRQCAGEDTMFETVEKNPLSTDDAGDDTGTMESGVWKALDGLTDPNH